MGLNRKQTRNCLIFSTLVSAAGFLAAFMGGLSKASLLLSGLLLVLHLAGWWAFIGRISFLQALFQSEAPASAPIVFLASLSTLGSGLGLVSWIFLFAAGSQVREALIQASPLIGWGVAVAVYGLTSAGALMNQGEEKNNGLLILAGLFSVTGQMFFFWLAAQLFAFTIDDAYITFRYSKNLAAGWGPTYNPGQPPVEGYTTFLWMIGMTLPHFVGVNVATFSKLISVLSLCATFLLVSLLTYDMTGSQPVKKRLFFAAFAAFVLSALPISAVHAVSGMETALFALLVSLLAWMVGRGLNDNSRLFSWAPLVGLLTGLTRPEGNAIALLLLGYGWLVSPPARRKRLLWSGLWLYVLPGAIYFVWRAWYYGLPLPLPFYMKVLRTQAFAGAGEVGAFLLYLLPSLIVFLLPVLLRFRKEYLPAMLPVAFLLVFYLFPVHAMGFEWRFVYPAAPLISVLAGVGGAELFGLLENKRPIRRPWELLLVGLLLTGTGNLGSLDGLVRSKHFYGNGISNYKTFGTLLTAFDDTHRLTLAIGDAGTVPYYADWQVIDLFGLNTREIGLSEIPALSMVFEEQPADLVLLSVGANPNRISDEHRGGQLLYQEAIRRGMARIGEFSFGRDNYIWVVAWPDTDLANYIQDNLETRD